MAERPTIRDDIYWNFARHLEADEKHPHPGFSGTCFDESSGDYVKDAAYDDDVCRLTECILVDPIA